MKPPPPFGKSIDGEDDGGRAGEHQRDQSEVETGEPERGQADQHADHHHLTAPASTRSSGNGIDVA